MIGSDIIKAMFNYDDIKGLFNLDYTVMITSLLTLPYDPLTYRLHAYKNQKRSLNHNLVADLSLWSILMLFRSHHIYSSISSHQYLPLNDDCLSLISSGCC